MILINFSIFISLKLTKFLPLQQRRIRKTILDSSNEGLPMFLKAVFKLVKKWILSKDAT